jgi:hypothetical protein
MQYHDFTDEELANAFLRDSRDAGWLAYLLTYCEGTYQVRRWKA